VKHSHTVERCLVAALLVGCGGRTPASPAVSARPPAEAANDAVRRSLSSVLQGRGAEAVATLRRPLEMDGITSRNAATYRCMLERLGERRLPENSIADPFVARVLTTYQEYWLGALLSDQPSPEHDAWLLRGLNRLVPDAGGGRAATLDDLEPVLDSLIRASGYHVLLGVTSPLRELMLWRTETERRYDVRLPEQVQPVTVMLMDDFASLGWAGFATCDRSHSGGWTRPDRLYAVQSAYDLESENYRVSYLGHEAQHFADHHRFPGLERQEELEYRAKLAELALADSTAYDLLEAFAGNVSDEPGVPHSYANGRVVRGLASRLFPDSAGAPRWRAAPVERINQDARELLRADTERLESAGPAVPADSSR
jgi:hypothetical protein